MRLLAILTAMLAFITAPALASVGVNFKTCHQKNPVVVKAIMMYCNLLGNQNVVPSIPGQGGLEAKLKGRKAKVWMRARCNPGQWVPKAYCYSQFYHMCANGDKKGNFAAQFGRDRCQDWYINA